MLVITENILEETCLGWLSELGWTVLHGPDIAQGASAQERVDYRQVILLGRLRDALFKVNPGIPAAAIEEALRRIEGIGGPDTLMNNRAFHRLLTDGIDVEVPQSGADHAGCGVQYRKIWLLDEECPSNNDWVALNQYSVVENQRNRRADVVLFINGLPLAVLELKNPGDENATITQAFNQLQTYKQDIGSLFIFNEILVISDGIQARCGTISSGWDRFMPWRTIDGESIVSKGMPELETTIRGLFRKDVLLDYILNFIVFEDDGTKIIKKSAAYHQYWAVGKALACTLSACGAVVQKEPAIRYGKGNNAFGNKRIGVIWHTQGSGKSLSMTFYAGKVIRHPAMHNPTLVILTDRNDLDDQLFGTFTGCRDLVRQSPVQAGSRAHLRGLLQVASGGLVFSTIQKFMPDQKGDTHPLLSERANIVVIADEAHRSQYDFVDGFARHLHDALPNASFIGFTGTPIESDDRNTPAVFGDYIDTYDIRRAVEDGATVPIYYENRLARIELVETERPHIDPEFEEITEDEEESGKQKLRTKWAALEAMVGAEKRIALVAEDLAAHFLKRLEVMDGKGMVVCMSRRIAVEMYEAIRKLCPGWHSDDDSSGMMKIVMSGSASDRQHWQPHIRNKAGREALSRRFKNPEDNLKLVIVRDMWLTGFDCPSLHTMYVDKPMNGHNLMQAIARVNRVFRDKPGGLVVDYLGLADSLKRALANYTDSGGNGDAAIDQEQAVAVFLEKYEIVRAMLHGFDYHAVIQGPYKQRITGIVKMMEFILGFEDGKKRFLPAISTLGKAFTLAVPHEKVLALRDDVGFFQEVRAALVKTTGDEQGRTPDDIETAIRQLVSRAVTSTEVVDIFTAAGMEKPDISILSDEFLEEVRLLPQRNLALELLKKLLNDEIKNSSRKNVVLARSFAVMLEESIRKYQNRAVETAEVIQELIRLAKELREASRRGEKLGLNDDEIAFYDALADNGSAVKVMGDDKLKVLAMELVLRVRQSITIDWTLRENARATIRVLVKRILRQFGYPPDMEQETIKLILEQAEILCEEWAH